LKLFKKALLWFKTFPKRVYEAFLRFPISALCSLALFTVFELQEHHDFFDDKIFYKLIFVLSVGFILFAAGELLLEGLNISNIKNRIITAGAVYLLIQGYYFVAATGDGARGFSQFAMVLCAAALFAIAAPYIKTGRGFEKNAALILVRLASSALFSFVLFLGVSAIFSGIDLLLVSLNGDWLGEVFRICFVIFLPIMFLMGVPKKDTDADYPKSLKALLSYVVLPVVIAFSAVLYLYYIKLIINRSLPISEAGGISLAFLAVCIPTLILISHFDGKLSFNVTKTLPFLLFPVIFVLYLAAIRQIMHYGITVTRYLVIIGGFGALVSVLLIKIKKGRLQRFSCIVVSACCILSAFGPQSAYNAASTSQSKRLKGLLTDNNMLIDGKIVPSENVSEDDKNEIAGLIRYIERSDLNKPSYLPEGDLKDILGFDVDRINKHYHTNERNSPKEITGYDYILYDYGSEFASFAKDGVSIEITRLSKEGITIKFNGEIVCDIPMSEISRNIFDKLDKEKDMQEEENLIYEFENDFVKLKYIFSSISFNGASYNYGGYTVLLKIKKTH